MRRAGRQRLAARASAQSRQPVDTHTAAHVDLNRREPHVDAQSTYLLVAEKEGRGCSIFRAILFDVLLLNFATTRAPACLATTTIHEAKNKFIVAFTIKQLGNTITMSQYPSVAPGQSTFKLNTGAEIPVVGLGTWQSPPGEVAKAVEAAIRAGYRHIDAAWIYGNEEEVGQGIKASGVARSELFVTTKVWGTYHRQPEACLDESLQKLGLEYVDLVLVHWPVPLEKRGDEKIPLNPDGSRALDRDWTPEQTWEQMEKLPATGKAKAIGVSNWSVPYLERLLVKAKTVPAANQVELHPFLPQHELVKFCQSKGILMQAYSPLGSSGGPVLQDELVQSIAKAHSADPAQVVVSWAAQRGVVALPKSVTPSRIETNHKLITLSDDEMLKLNELHQQEGKSVRLVSPNWGVDLEW